MPGNTFCVFVDVVIRDRRQIHRGLRQRDEPGSVCGAIAFPGVPRISVFGELRWQHLPRGFATSVAARHASQVIVDDQNSDAAAAYTMTNLRFCLAQKAKDWRVTQTLRIDNMANVNYNGPVIVDDSNSRFVETAPRPDAAVLINGKLNF